jgi:hypothetical protein
VLAGAAVVIGVTTIAAIVVPARTAATLEIAAVLRSE